MRPLGRLLNESDMLCLVLCGDQNANVYFVLGNIDGLTETGFDAGRKSCLPDATLLAVTFN